MPASTTFARTGFSTHEPRKPMLYRLERHPGPMRATLSGSVLSSTPLLNCPVEERVDRPVAYAHRAGLGAGPGEEGKEGLDMLAADCSDAR